MELKRPVSKKLKSLNFTQENFHKSPVVKGQNIQNEKVLVKNYFKDTNKKKSYNNQLQILKSDIVNLDHYLKENKNFLLIFQEEETLKLKSKFQNVSGNSLQQKAKNQIKEILESCKETNQIKDQLELICQLNKCEDITKKYDNSCVEELVVKFYLENALNELFFKKLKDVFFIEELKFHGSIDELISKSNLFDSFSKFNTVNNFLNRINSSIHRNQERTMPSSPERFSSDELSKNRPFSHHTIVPANTLTKFKETTKDEFCSNCKNSLFMTNLDLSSRINKIKEDDNEFENSSVCTKKLFDDIDKEKISSKAFYEFILNSNSINQILLFEGINGGGEIVDFDKFKRQDTLTLLPSGLTSLDWQVIIHIKKLISNSLYKIFELFSSISSIKNKDGDNKFHDYDKQSFLNLISSSYLDPFLKKFEKIEKDIILISKSAEKASKLNELLEIKEYELSEANKNLSKIKYKYDIEHKLKTLTRENYSHLNENMEKTFSIIKNKQPSKLNLNEKINFEVKIEELQTLNNELKSKNELLERELTLKPKLSKNDKSIEEYISLLKEQFDKMKASYAKQIEEKDWILRDQRKLYKEKLSTMEEEIDGLNIIKESYFKLCNQYDQILKDLSNLKVSINIE